MKNIKIRQNSEHNNETEDIIAFFDNKINSFQNMVLSTLLMIQKYKTMNIFGARELNICVQGLTGIFQDIRNIETILSGKKKNTDDILSRLQSINNEMSQIFRSFGTEKIVDLNAIIKCKIKTSESDDSYEIIETTPGRIFFNEGKDYLIMSEKDILAIV